MKKKKLIAIMLLMLTLALSLSSLSACGDEDVKYEAEVVFTVGTRYDYLDNATRITLTKDNNVKAIDFGLDTDEIPVFAQYQMVRVRSGKKTVEKSFYLYPNGTTPSGNGMPFIPTEFPPSYKITDKAGTTRYGRLDVDYQDKIAQANEEYRNGECSINKHIFGKFSTKR